VHGGGTRKKPAIELEYLRTLLEHFPTHKRGLRDRAIFMIGFCGGLRCEELMRLDYAEFGEGAIGCLRIDRDGATIEMRYGGTASTRARTALKYIARCPDFCPVRALEDWIAEAHVTRGPLFRAIDKHGHVGETRLLRNNMSVLLRRALRDAEVALGRSPAEAAAIARPYSVQSLRIGFIKSALEAGATPERIAMHLGWTTAQSIDQYRRRYKTVRGNPLLAVMAAADNASDAEGAGTAAPGTLSGVRGCHEDPATADSVPGLGLGRNEFMCRYGSEDGCHEALVLWRWPDGFRCPRCRRSQHSYGPVRRVYRCVACKLQTTARSGTIFHNSRLPLTTWFHAYYVLRSGQTNVTPPQLARELDIKWDTALRMKRILMSAMGEDDGNFELDGLLRAGSDKERGDQKGS